MTSTQTAAQKPTHRARITNNVAGIAGVDGRSLWARRYRDIVEALIDDLGGEDCVSQAEIHLVRRCATLTTELERLETRFAGAEGAAAADLDAFQRATNTLRRTLQVLGLERRLKDVTPDLKDYLEGKAS